MHNSTTPPLTKEEVDRRYKSTMAILAEIMAELPKSELTDEQIEHNELVNVLDRAVQ